MINKLISQVSFVDMLRSKSTKTIVMLAVAIATLFVAISLTSRSSTAHAATTGSSKTVPCSTGGVWYMTDSMYVVRTNVGGSRPWKYVITYSKDRDVYTGATYVNHKAYLLNRYTNGHVIGYAPKQGFTVYSTSSTEDYGMFWHVTPSGAKTQNTKCYSRF